MAKVKFLKGVKKNLPSVGADGVMYLATDEDRLYYGDGTNKPKEIKGITYTVSGDGNGTITLTDSNGKSSTTKVYEHPTTAGNKHIPAGGSDGQALVYSANGTAKWGNPANALALVNPNTGAKFEASDISTIIKSIPHTYTIKYTRVSTGDIYSTASAFIFDITTTKSPSEYESVSKFVEAVIIDMSTGTRRSDLCIKATPIDIPNQVGRGIVYTKHPNNAKVTWYIPHGTDIDIYWYYDNYNATYSLTASSWIQPGSSGSDNMYPKDVISTDIGFWSPEDWTIIRSV